jgi:hypothetical protein
MAKRTRGSTRPGQRRPIDRGGRPTARAAAAPGTGSAPRPTTLTPDEEARAAELEARIVAEERAAEEAVRSAVARERRAAEAREAGQRGGASLATRASEEYAYVVRDMRRITIIGSVLFAILVGLWIALQVSGFTLA